MQRLAILVLLICAHAYDDDVQLIKSVKGGHGQFQYNPYADVRFYPNNTQYIPISKYPEHPGASNRSVAVPVEQDIGVCYTEVPTASLARDPAHVPTGNGSRPDLSVIRTCCKGYSRNIHNFRLCNPVCSNDCVNGLCTSPEICTCFPDHVRNLAGFCIPTCPIGCQNGHCNGGECLCKEGYKLEANRKYCVPKCLENCGGIGNCTAPNTCACKTGYQSTPEGTCKAICDRPCTNGDCVAPNVCECTSGYFKDQRGICIPNCPQGCAPNGRCVSPNHCEYPATTPKSVVIPYQPPNQPNRPSNSPGGSFYYPPSSGLSGNNHISSSSQINGGHGQPNYPGQYNPGQNLDNQSNLPHQPSGQGQSNYPGQYNPGQNLNNQSNLPHQPSGYGQSNYPGQYNPGQNLDNQSNLPHQSNQQYPIYPDIQFSRPNQTNQQYPLSPDNQFYRPNNNPNPSLNLYPDIQFYQPNQPNSQYPVNSYSQTNQHNLPGQTLESYQCTEICINGLCVEGNKCSCLSGHVPDVTDASGRRCVPYCASGCPNGICTAPNRCICNMGFVKDVSVKGRQVCVARTRRSISSGLLKQLTFKIPDL